MKKRLLGVIMSMVVMATVLGCGNSSTAATAETAAPETVAPSEEPVAETEKTEETQADAQTETQG